MLLFSNSEDFSTKLPILFSSQNPALVKALSDSDSELRKKIMMLRNYDEIPNLRVTIGQREETIIFELQINALGFFH